MNRMHWPARLLAGFGLAALASLSGCQTWTAGMTLPSGRYLEHPPQFFPPSPPFPLSRELASQERAAAEGFGPGPGAAAPLPPPVAPLPAGPPEPPPLPPPP
jgi:hypothetical protein